MAFFSNPYSPFEFFNFLLHLFISLHLWITYRVGTVHMSSTKIYKLLNTHDSYHTELYEDSIL